MKSVQKTFSIIDTLSVLAELEHMRRHCLLASVNSPEEKVLSYLVLASQCQVLRRTIQNRYFKELEDRDWCIVKSAARLLQLTEETANSDLEELKSLKGIVDSAIMIATGEDISQCEACTTDFSNIS